MLRVQHTSARAAILGRKSAERRTDSFITHRLPSLGLTEVGQEQNTNALSALVV